MHMLSHIVSGRIMCICVTPVGENTGELDLVSLGLFPHMPFPCADFNLYPFTVKIETMSIMTVQSPVGPASKS